MVYTIAEIAQKLNISKVAVYKRINKIGGDLNSCISKNKGVTYVSEEGYFKLRDNFKQEKDNKVKTVKSDRTALIEQYEARIKELTSTLDRERQDKDRYIALYLDVRNQNQFLLESTAAKEEKKSFFAKLFGKSNRRNL